MCFVLWSGSVDVSVSAGWCWKCCWTCLCCVRRERTPPEVRAAREREMELRELEKDTRTIFAYNLNLKADERDLFDFFSKAGKVTDVKIIMDRNTRKSKGFAYIEFDKQVRS